MLCQKPYILSDMQPCACSTCDVCRIRRKKQWADRIILESFKHADSSFVTLTYDEDHLPAGGTLVPKDAQDWLKRLRFALSPNKLRYYLVGEYGGDSWRPHYHAAVFGLSPTEVSVVESTWSLGFCTLGTLTPESSAYIAGYVTKKMGKQGDVSLAGRHAEFQRMSLKPGIGALAIEDIGRVLMSDAGIEHVRQMGDVPHELLIGKKSLALGRYLRGKLREYMGFGSKDVPPEALKAFKEEMRKLYEENVENPESTSGARKLQFQMNLLDMNSQKLRNVLSRSKVYSARKEL